VAHDRVQCTDSAMAISCKEVPRPTVLAMKCANASRPCRFTHRLQLTGARCGCNQQLNDGQLLVSCRRTSVATRIDRPPSVKVRVAHKPAGTQVLIYSCVPSAYLLKQVGQTNRMTN